VRKASILVQETVSKLDIQTCLFSFCEASDNFAVRNYVEIIVVPLAGRPTADARLRTRESFSIGQLLYGTSLLGRSGETRQPSLGTIALPILVRSTHAVLPVGPLDDERPQGNWFGLLRSAAPARMCGVLRGGHSNGILQSDSCRKHMWSLGFRCESQPCPGRSCLATGCLISRGGRLKIGFVQLKSEAICSDFTFPIIPI
jgi:hypothetical protein